ncbi:MAG: hypothetical protein QXX30_01240 [Candidatus Aenigmatarchaeota archaeon]
MKSRKIFKTLVKGYKNVKNSEEKVVDIGNKPSLMPNSSELDIISSLEKIINKIQQKDEKEEEKKIEGISIPRSLRVHTPPIVLEREEEFHLKYPLIPRNAKEGEKVYASANIYFDREKNKYIYEVIEPPLDQRLKDIKEKIEVLLEQKLDVDLSKLNILKAKEYLRTQLDEIIRYFKFRLSEEEYNNLKYYIERDFLGLGKIEPLMQDNNIEDIIEILD